MNTLCHPFGKSTLYFSILKTEYSSLRLIQNSLNLLDHRSFSASVYINIINGSKLLCIPEPEAIGMNLVIKLLPVTETSLTNW